MIEATALVVFPILMVFSAFSDLLTMTIPNRVSLALVAAFAALAIYLHMPLPAIASHVACGLAMLLVTFVMFNFGLIGGGDAKLAAATAMWIGWGALLDYGLIASLAGGVLALAILELRRHELPSSLSALPFLARGGAGVPYGIALAAAGLLVYPQSQIWALLSAA